MYRFNEKIKILRRKKNLDLRVVADFLDLNPAQMAAMEEGKRSATKDQVLILASILEADDKELLMGYLSDQISKESYTKDASIRACKLQDELNKLQNRRIHFRMHKPSPPLNAFIKAIIYYKGDHGINSFERTLPDGNIELVFDLNEFGNGSGSDHKTPLVWVTNVRKHHATAQPARKAALLIVQFTPGGFHALTKKSPYEIKNPHTDASFIFGNDVLLLRDQMLESLRNRKHPFPLLEVFFRSKVQDQTNEHALIRYMAQNINLPVQQLVRKTGYTHKHVLQLFKKYTGMAPKYYQRIWRFNNSLKDILGAGSPVNWMDVAFKNGFYDQSHFIKEFRHFTGFNPQTYLDTGSTCSRLIHFHNTQVNYLQ